MLPIPIPTRSRQHVGYIGLGLYLVAKSVEGKFSFRLQVIMRLACKTFDILIYYYKLAKISCCYVRAHYTANCHMQAEYDFVQWEDVRLKIKV